MAVTVREMCCVYTTGLHKVVLQHREDMDSLGLHLSGGLPPVTITYLEPGGQAEKAGVKVGDVLLDVNGLNCRKKVEIAQLMRFKIMIQEPPKENMDKQEQADVSQINNACTHTHKYIEVVLPIFLTHYA